MKVHYTYQITNTKIQRHYIGVRSCEETPDIGVGYFSNSRDEEFMKEQKNNPQSFVYFVLREFDTRKEAVQHEIYLHNINDVAINPKYYNKSKQTSTGFDTTGISYEDHPKGMKGKSHSKETKLIQSQKNKEYWSTRVHPTKGVSSWNLGLEFSDSAKKNMSESTKEYYKTNTIHNKDTGRKVIIDGVIYNNTRLASEALGVSIPTVKNRINYPHLYSGWVYYD